MFRYLEGNEIDVRVAQCFNTANYQGVSLLLYKDARCDQNILDETVGAMNWRNHYSNGNANCTVEIWDEKKEQWIAKENVGTESNTEKEKGLASDSFKRACFNWGIGRELYTAPTIMVSADKLDKFKVDKTTGKAKCNDKFFVSFIKVEDGKIVQLLIKKQNGYKVEDVFKYGF